MNIHDELPVRGCLVRDSAGDRVGRSVEIDHAATGTSEAGYLLRLTGSRRGFGAVPAASARCGKRRSVQLACARAIQVRSPHLSRQGRRHSSTQAGLHASYAPVTRV